MSKIKRRLKPQNVTVRDLAEKFNLKPVQIRRILRANQIRPKLVDVVEGWPNQKRIQYVWQITDPELKTVLAAIHEAIAPEDESDLIR